MVGSCKLPEFWTGAYRCNLLNGRTTVDDLSGTLVTGLALGSRHWALDAEVGRRLEMDDATHLNVTPTLWIPRAELSYRASRAGGPGGQHVNTSSTRIELIWDLPNSRAVTDDERARIRGWRRDSTRTAACAS